MVKDWGESLGCERAGGARLRPGSDKSSLMLVEHGISKQGAKVRLMTTPRFSNRHYRRHRSGTLSRYTRPTAITCLACVTLIANAAQSSAEETRPWLEFGVSAESATEACATNTLDFGRYFRSDVERCQFIVTSERQGNLYEYENVIEKEADTGDSISQCGLEPSTVRFSRSESTTAGVTVTDGNSNSIAVTATATLKGIFMEASTSLQYTRTSSHYVAYQNMQSVTNTVDTGGAWRKSTQLTFNPKAIIANGYWQIQLKRTHNPDGTTTTHNPSDPKNILRVNSVVKFPIHSGDNKIQGTWATRIEDCLPSPMAAMNKCLDLRDGDSGGTIPNGRPVQLYRCKSNPAQQVTFLANHQLKVRDKCISPVDDKMTNGTKLHVWSCVNGHKPMTWYPTGSDGGFSWQNGANRNMCIDIPGAKSIDLSQLQLYRCNNDSGAQRFTTKWDSIR
ncbi:RICIN domain-containing protein [Streptomyces sp. NPDC019396]|uniref:RICIN domain-containing protein n=1 Tax=Streptomyces sp. NPDC019396 TaxID=3154687 RepID=UPI0033D9828D